MKKIIFYSIAFVFLFSACKKQKELPKADAADPVFYVKCDLDGSPLDIRAGDNDYYMNSSWYHDDPKNIYVYQGNLAKPDGAGYQVTILINDYKKTEANGLMFADSALMPGEHLYNDNNSSGLTQNWTFIPVTPLEDDAMYVWTLMDGIMEPKTIGGTGSEGYYNISRVLNVGKTYSVSLNYTKSDGSCSNSHTNVFNIGNRIQTTVSATRDMTAHGLTYKLSYTLPPYANSSWNCVWEFEDTSIVNKPEIIKSFSTGDHLVKLKLIDSSTNDTCISYYKLNASDGTVCQANYTAHFLPIQNARLYSSITILVTDPNGVVYTTKDLVQPQTSNFEIQEIGNYQANDKGQPTKRLKVKFNCIVKNGNNQIVLSNGEAKIAVAYK